MSEPDRKRCTKCGETKPLEEFGRNLHSLDGLKSACKACLSEESRRYREAHPERRRESTRRYREANTERIHDENRRYREAHPEQTREAVRRWQEAHPDRRREAARAYRNRLFARVLAHYGAVCACCGATDDLSIDHVNGGGKQHRLELGGTAALVHRWLIDNDFPEGFQTLCVPCNSSKGEGDHCRLQHASVTA